MWATVQWVRSFGGQVEIDRVRSCQQKGIEVCGLRCRGINWCLHHRYAVGIVDEDPGRECVADLSPHRKALAPHVRVRVVRIELDAGPERIAAKGLLDVKVHISIVPSGSNEHDTLGGILFNGLTDQGVAVQCTDPIQAPAHVDHQALLILLRNGLHPSEGIDHGSSIHQPGAEKELRIEGDPTEFGSGTTTTRNACYMRAVGGVTINIDRVGPSGHQCFWRVQFRTVREIRR